MNLWNRLFNRKSFDDLPDDHVKSFINSINLNFKNKEKIKLYNYFKNHSFMLNPDNIKNYPDEIDLIVYNDICFNEIYPYEVTLYKTNENGYYYCLHYDYEVFQYMDGIYIIYDDIIFVNDEIMDELIDKSEEYKKELEGLI